MTDDYNRESEEECHSEIDGLMDENDGSLTEEEYEKKCHLKELGDDGYFDPYRIDQGDIAELMALNNIVSIEDAYAHNFAEGDQMRLADVLERNWFNLDNFSKVVYHVIRNTPNPPKWRRPYPPTVEYIRDLEEFLHIDPRLREF